MLSDSPPVSEDGSVVDFQLNCSVPLLLLLLGLVRCLNALA
jgi:hypothetical protein